MCMNGPFRGGVLDAVVRMGDCSDGRGGGAVLDGLGLHGGPLLLVRACHHCNINIGTGNEATVDALIKKIDGMMLQAEYRYMTTCNTMQ